MKTKILKPTITSENILGIIMRIQYETNSFPTDNFYNYLDGLLIPAIELNNVRIITDLNDCPVSYFIWGFLTETLHHALLKRESVRLDLDDWNGGDTLWVLDYRYPEGKPMVLVRNVLSSFEFDRIYVPVGSCVLMCDNKTVKRII